MSAALERVIAEQQKEIDRLNAIRQSADQANIRQFKKLEDVFHAMGEFIDYNPRKAWRDDAKDEWDRYHSLKSAARLSMVEAGVCYSCWSIACHGDCCE